MKLYYSPGACSLASHIALEETGLKYEAIAAPTKTKVLPDGSDYRKVNPLGRLKWVDGELAGKPFLMGNDFTVADAYLFVVTNWAQPLNVDLSPFKNLLAFRERVAARPAVQAAMKTEGLG